MKYAIITDGVVTNVADADADTAAERGWIACPYWVWFGDTYAAGIFTPKPEEEPATIVQTPTIYAVGNFAVADSDITGIETAVNFSAAFWAGVGVYYVVFSEMQANTQYLAKAYSGTSQALVVEKGEDYIIVNATDTSGPYDPAEFSVEIIRVQ